MTTNEKAYLIGSIAGSVTLALVAVLLPFGIIWAVATIAGVPVVFSFKAWCAGAVLYLAARTRISL